MNKAFIKNLILVLGTVVIACLSLWLPGYLMHRDMQNSYNTLSEVPAGYYAGPSKTIIKNVSKQLTSQQRIQLITGQWESEIRPADEDETTLTNLGIKTLATIHINDLYVRGLYPIKISSDYGNWYSWSVKPYRALDTTFQSYAAIYWEVDFDKYDNTEHHRFIVTDTGDILYANAIMSEPDMSTFNPNLKNCTYLLYNYGEISRTEFNSSVYVTVANDDQTTTYRSSTATDAAAQLFDSSSASSFIENYSGFEPDTIYSISGSGGTTNTYKYLVGCQKTDTTYTILLLPQD